MDPEIFNSIDKGDLTKLASCIASGEKNKQNSAGLSPLMFAIRTKKTDAVELLLSSDVDLNARDDDGKTAMIIACEAHQYSLAGRVLELGADSNIMDNDRQTAYKLAIAEEDINIEDANEFCEKLCDLGGEEITSNAILYAVRFCKIGVVDKILNLHPSLTSQTNLYNQSLMHIAAKFGDQNLLEFLYSKGCNYTSKDSAGLRPVHITILYNRSDIFKVFMDVLDVEILFSELEIQLKDKVFNNDDIKFIIDNLSDINKKFEKDESFLSWAYRIGNSEIVQYILNNFDEVIDIDIFSDGLETPPLEFPVNNLLGEGSLEKEDDISLGVVKIG
jgi:uncharacterized protein